MPRLSNSLVVLALAAELVLVVTPRAALAAADPPVERSDCFYVNQIRGSRPLDDRTVLFRVNTSDIYRLEFAHSCPDLTLPRPKLIIVPFGGVGLICHAIDIDVKVGEQGPGFIPMGCIAKSLRKLTPDEAAAVPKKNLP